MAGVIVNNNFLKLPFLYVKALAEFCVILRCCICLMLWYNFIILRGDDYRVPGAVL